MNIKIAENGIWVSQAVKQNDGYIFCRWGGVCDLSYPDSKLRRGRVQGNGEICPTLTGNIGIYVVMPSQSGPGHT